LQYSLQIVLDDQFAIIILSCNYCCSIESDENDLITKKVKWQLSSSFQLPMQLNKKIMLKKIKSVHADGGPRSPSAHA
jgi:hypothetical protein